MTARQAKSDFASAVVPRPNISKDLDLALATNQNAQLFRDVHGYLLSRLEHAS